MNGQNPGNDGTFNIFSDGPPDLGSAQAPDPFAPAANAPFIGEPIAQPETAQVHQAPAAPVGQAAPAQPEPAQQPLPVQETAPAQAATIHQPTSVPAAPQTIATDAEPQNPLEAAVVQAEEKQTAVTADALFSKPPVFEYASASEDIGNTSITFEQLRIEKKDDFPELDDGKRVSWTMEYNTIVKQVPNPSKTVIGDLKKEIENSKAFLDALKKAKDKNPVCKVKPKITAQSKGKLPAYKGVFITMEDAVQSGKLITLFPAKDGNVYEMRQNEMGRFITHSKGSDMLSEVKAGFIPALPPIPWWRLLEIISFFKMMATQGCNEALANIYWDKEEQVYITDIPPQAVTPTSVKGITNPAYDNDRYIHYMDIHSHNVMRAYFSSTDDKDEKATRVYTVIGKVLDYFPEIKVRISNGGTFHEIEPGVVFEEYNYMKKMASLWFNNIKYKAQVFAELLFGLSEQNPWGDCQ